MFYLTSKSPDDNVTTVLGFMEGRGGFWIPPPQTQKLRKSPRRIGLNQGTNFA